MDRRFYYINLSLFTLGLYPLLKYDKVTSLLKMIPYRSPVLDGMMCVLTHIGNGWMGTLIALAWSLYSNNYRKSLMILGAFGGMSIAVQTLKYLIFPNILRPIAAIPAIRPMIPYVDWSATSSFPSGHAGAVFALISIYQCTGQVSWLGIIFSYLFALVIAYSRMYLYQHFYTDVYAGALIGVLATCVSYHLARRLPCPWLDRPIFDIGKGSTD